MGAPRSPALERLAREPLQFQIHGRSVKITLTLAAAGKSIEMMCAWADCRAATPEPAKELPPGWRFLITAKGWLFIDEPPSIERDAVLCPIHVGMLDALLKKI
jgi:hypothetical protein